MKDASINGTGWSPIALMFALILGALMILALPILGFERYQNMPLAGNNSAAISAAHHRQEDEGANTVWCPLKYGVLRSTDAEGRQRVGFSAEEVLSLLTEVVYI